MPSIFQEVKQSVSTRDALAYLNIAITKIEHGKDGEQLRGCCPKCGERDKDKRGLSVNTDTGKFRCFLCPGKGNDIISLVHWAEDVSQTEAAQRLHNRYVSASRYSSSTEPRPSKAVEVKGRPEPSETELRPLEILGMSDEHTERLGVTELDGRVLFIQRDKQGVEIGTLALATRDDLPLVEWIETDAEADQPKTLQSLWRVVKGGA